MKTLSLAVAFCAALTVAHADDGDDKDKWDVAAPPLPTRKVQIDVTEGTWMNIDVSPDGRMVAFDLLGDIYTLPIAGGTARRIAEGLPFEMQPQFSPDGSKIAFTSDRGGGDNIWIMNADGSDKRQLTNEKFRLLNEPAWSKDGKYIAARKHFTTGRSLGTGEIWLYHLGGGDGIKLVKRSSEQLQKELGEPAFSSDGESIYYSRNTTPGNTFIYAQDSNGEIFAIEKYEIETGEVSTVVGGAGGAVRPTPSPDGKYLAFVKRERNKSKLFLKDLRSGAIRKLYDDLDQDVQETWAVHGVYPTMDWTPDSQNVVFWAGGKIRRVALNGTAREIPFKVTDDRVIIDPPHPQVAIAPDTFTTKMPRFVSVAPNGRSVVFETLGKLYVKSLPNGTPRRLTSSSSDATELFASWSYDGSRVVYVEWTDAGLGQIKTVGASGGGGNTVTNRPGIYRRPRFSPDGRTIVFERGSGGNLLSYDWSDDPGVYRIAANGGAQTKVSDDGNTPHFGAGNDRIFMTASGEDNSVDLVSTDLTGEARRTHATSELIGVYEVSPAGDAVAFRENWAAYVMPMPLGAASVGAGKDGSATSVVKASKGGAAYIHWSDGGKQLNWSLGPALYSAKLADMIPSMPKPKKEEGDDSEDAGFEPPTSGVSLAIDVTADKPSGTVALTGARIVTMTDKDGGVIEDGVIVINGNRIAAIGARGDVNIPSGAKTVDVAGKTIVPGLIDAHAHGPQGDDDIIPQQNWSALAHLALGVTTIHDPSSSSNEIFPASEMQRAGKMVMPRTLSTGEVVYGAKAPGFFAEINSYQDALDHVQRLKAEGAFSIKNYNQPRREERQQVVKAAIEENMAVVAEGASLFTQDITLIADGNTSVEHNLPQSVFYEDVLSFFSQTKVDYVPTLIVTYGGLAGQPYWQYATDVWTHPILSKHVPPHILQPANVRRTKAPDEDFVDQYSAREAKKLADRGVLVSTGAHGQEEGMGTHWEIWSFVRGGWSNVQALSAATSMPAKHLGLAADLGTLEEGKLADLLVLDANPLDDISNTDKISRVMLNGRLYDPVTMNEVVTGTHKHAPYYWE